MKFAVTPLVLTPFCPSPRPAHRGVLAGAELQDLVAVPEPAGVRRHELEVDKMPGKRDSIHHHLLEVIFETATLPELGLKLLYTTSSGWWWCIESVFRVPVGGGVDAQPSRQREVLAPLLDLG